MVMKNVMAKNLQKSITKSITRYLAIVAIIALGAAIFVGLRTTKSDMIATGQQYMDRQAMFDLRVLNTYGWTADQVEKLRELPGVEKAEGTVSVDVLGQLDSTQQDNVYKLFAIPELVNKVELQGGRMPQNAGECLVDGFHMNDSILGKTFTISPVNDQQTLDSFTQYTFTVVGYVRTPVYMDMSRGTTTLGNGSVTGFVYLPQESFQVDYFSEINLTLEGDYSVYTQRYEDAVTEASDRLTPQLEILAQERMEQVRQEAMDAYLEGLAEYNDGFRSYLQGRNEAMEELKKAQQELTDAQNTLDENRTLISDGQTQLAEGEKTLAEKKQELLAGEAELNYQEQSGREQMDQAYQELQENEKTVSENLALVNDGLAQLDSGLQQLNDGISQLESGLQQLDTTLTMLEGLNTAAETAISAAQQGLDAAESLGLPASVIQDLRKQLESLNQQRQEYVQQQAELESQYETYSQQLVQLKTQQTELQAQRQELVNNKALLEDGMAQIQSGYAQLEKAKADAQIQITQARLEIEKGKTLIAQSELELAQKKQELADGLEALEEGAKELESGWEEFNQAKLDAEQELADARAELDDARRELDDALHEILNLEQPELFVLDRNTNPGYLSLDSNSDIVKGVSTVFPAFFLLIAALVCITTMTRMVEEERTQIGTLKALGYTNWEIIRKYLIYSGSAALIGCGLGVLAGSVVFPIILWQAYGILFNVASRVVLKFDWLLCGGVVAAYTAVNLLVTWYCCHRILKEVPAQLIRPKAPTSGKKIFLEYLPFWNRLSFLNKVMLRNIFRYTQRLLMMLIGIGGCTALLVTGFGIGDSIANIVTYQFEEITLYDMDVRFSEGQSQEQMASFRQEVQSYAEDIYFFHQSSAELNYDGASRDITLIAANEGITEHLDFHYKGKHLDMPGQGEVLISVGAANILGVSRGDTVTIRNSDLQEMKLKVSGIYENYVYNYVIVHEDTYAQHWGGQPEYQVACLKVRQGEDVHKAGSLSSQAEGVISVMISQDLADQVGTMMSALDLVILTVVICAGALAGIVLYNLTNINITERIREIATIKVLGFRSGESAAYVFKENLLLSVMGAGIGLLAGKWLLSFVISMIKVDMVWLQTKISLTSYILSIVLTIACALLVDFILYFRLEKINMAEALKSVE